MDGAYNTALSHLRGIREDALVRAREEQSSLFNWKGKKRGPSAAATSTSWKHSYFCLSSTSADRVPTSQSGKLVLEEAGLGEKAVTVPDLDCSAEEFCEVLMGAYPKLRSGGGFELLRCKSKSRDLVLIGHRISNVPRLLKRSVGNGRIYVRPVQRDLSLDACEEEVEGVRSACWYKVYGVGFGTLAALSV